MKLQIGEYSACIVVDGEERECYDVQTSEDELTVECWIVFEVGKVLAISSFRRHFTHSGQVFL